MPHSAPWGEATQVLTLHGRPARLALPCCGSGVWFLLGAAFPSCFLSSSPASLYFLLLSWTQRTLKILTEAKMLPAVRARQTRGGSCSSVPSACSAEPTLQAALPGSCSALLSSLQAAPTRVGTHQSLAWWGSWSGCSGRLRPRHALQSQPSSLHKDWLLPGTSQCSSCT